MRMIGFCTVRVLAEGDDAGDVGGSGQDTHCFERSHGYGVRVEMWMRWTAFRVWEKKQEGLHTEKKSRELAYIFLHASARDRVVQKEKRERERDTTSASALKSSWDVHYREVTGWQTTVGTQALPYFYSFEWTRNDLNLQFSKDFGARHCKNEERGERPWQPAAQNLRKTYILRRWQVDRQL